MHPNKFGPPTEDDIRLKKMNTVFYAAIAGSLLVIIYLLWS